MNTIGPLVGIATLVVTLFTAQEKPQVPTTGPDHVLAAQPLHFGSTQGTLTLYQRELAKPTTAAQLRYMLYTKPAAGADSNLVFYLLAITGKPAQERIVWLTYDASPEFVRPKPIFSASMQAAAQGDTVYVVLAKSVDTEAVFRIYVVTAAKDVASLPLRLDPERREEWPEPSQPQSELSYAAPPLSGCVVTSINLFSGPAGISIRAHRKPSTCSPLQATFDPRSGRWSKVVEQTDNYR